MPFLVQASSLQNSHKTSPFWNDKNHNDNNSGAGEEVKAKGGIFLRQFTGFSQSKSRRIRRWAHFWREPCQYFLKKTGNYMGLKKIVPDRKKLLTGLESVL
jgi:hypothetical protein